MAKDNIQRKTTTQLSEEIEQLKKDFKKLVKERGMLENKKSGSKIDSLLEDGFLEELRGNGKPSILEKMRDNEKDHEDYDRIKKEIEGNGEVGLCEKYRFQWKMVASQWVVIAFLVYLSLGGNFRGITWESIKENLGITPKIEKIETPPTEEEKKPVIIIEEEPIQNIKK